MRFNINKTVCPTPRICIVKIFSTAGGHYALDDRNNVHNISWGKGFDSKNVEQKTPWASVEVLKEKPPIKGQPKVFISVVLSLASTLKEIEEALQSA